MSDRLEVFDVSGATVQLHAERVRRTRFTVGGGELVLDGLDRGPRAAMRFRVLLRDYVVAVGAPRVGLEGANVDEMPLHQLAERVASFSA